MYVHRYPVYVCTYVAELSIHMLLTFSFSATCIVVLALRHHIGQAGLREEFTLMLQSFFP